MMQKNLLTAAAACVLASAAFVAHAQTDVQELADRWTRAYNTYDEAALAELYTENAHLMMHGAPTYVGRESIQAFWVEDFKENNPLTILTVTHSVDGVDMILVHGNYQVINRNDGTPLGFGRFAHIWTLGDSGDWRLDRDLWNQPHEPYVP